MLKARCWVTLRGPWPFQTWHKHQRDQKIQKESYTLNDTFHSLMFVWNITDDKSFSVCWRRHCAAQQPVSCQSERWFLTRPPAELNSRTSKINQINASPGRARAWRHMNICASHPVWDPIGSVRTHADRPQWSWRCGAGRYLSVRLCPSKATSSLSSTPLPLFICLPSSDSSVQFPRSPFAWSHALPLPSPPCGSASLISSRDTSFCLFKVENCDMLFCKDQNITKYCALSSKIYNLPPFFFLP